MGVRPFPWHRKMARRFALFAEQALAAILRFVRILRPGLRSESRHSLALGADDHLGILRIVRIMRAGLRVQPVR